MALDIIYTQRDSIFKGSMENQSEPDIRESQWPRDIHSKTIPPQIQMRERDVFKDR
jgi:hypothetical protein